MNIELNRLNTFHSWPVSFIDKHQLARFGFFYYGPSDLVKCFFCKVEIGMWEEGDDVLTDHIRWSDRCPLILGFPTDNVAIDENLLREQLPPPVAGEDNGEDNNGEGEGEDVVGTETVIGFEGILFSDFFRNFTSQFPIIDPIDPEPNANPVHHTIHYMTELERLKSFVDWPKALKQKPEHLSDAGFFYTGKGDKVTCFSCGGCLKDWEPEDDPWEQHAMNYRNCEYLIQMKGVEFIEQLHQRKDVKNKEDKEEEKEKEEKEDGEKGDMIEKYCKICLENLQNTVFIPCGHVCTCVKCAFSVTKCPICREPYEKVIRIFYS